MQEQSANFSLTLDGGWTLRHCPIGEGSYEGFRALTAYPYVVPGDVHTPLIDAGVIPEPLQDRNSLDCRWLEEEEFWCLRSFILTPQQLRKNMELTFHGLDCTADIYFNGQFLRRTENAFVEHHLDVSQLVQPGENELVVRIDQGLRAVQHKPLGTLGSSWNNEQPYRAWMRKPQYVYGWDWTVWLPTCGIWRGVELTGHQSVALRDVHAYTTEAQLTAGQPARINLDLTLSAGSVGYTAAYEIQDRDGQSVLSGEETITGICHSIPLTIPHARLWWSNGLGQPHLYRVTVRLLDPDGQIVQTMEQKLGLRTIALRQEPVGDGETGFTFVLNGVPIFCKGANVTVEDCLIGRVTDDHTRKTVELAKNCNMNMLRIWGGGVYASEAMLDACDESGILIWHDFMFACGYHPDDDPDFMANVENEAERAIRRLRRHACVIGWSGNNEIHEMYVSQSTWAPDLPFRGQRIYEQLLPRLVQQHHPGVIYRASSPLGEPADPAGITCGDQHKWDFTHRPNSPLYLDLWRFTDFHYKFLSEFGVIGAMNLESAKKCISSEHLSPDDPVWLHHTNNSQNHQLLNLFVDKYFGGHREMDLQQYTLLSQAIQTEVTRHIYDECRARKFVCSGLLFWTLGDSWGIHNWSLLDYWQQPRPVYYALRRACAPVTVVIRGYPVQTDAGSRNYRQYWAGDCAPVAIWGVNDLTAEQELTVSYRLMSLAGKDLLAGEQSCTLAPNASQKLLEVPVAGLGFDPEDTVLYARLCRDGVCISENRYFFAPIGQLRYRSSTPVCHTEKTAPNTWQLRLSSPGFVWGVHLEIGEDTVLSDNDFDLFPGVERIVTVRCPREDYRPTLHWIGSDRPGR